MKKAFVFTIVLGLSLVNAADLTTAFESPDATKIVKKDLLVDAKKFTMPSNCITKNKDAIARGKFIFHNLNGKKAKGKVPTGLSKKLANGKTKQFGNCVACHNVEGAIGGGNVGPDLTSYQELFIKTGARDNQFVYQKIADARIDNPNTHMTINLTSKMFNEREICDIASYVVSSKK